MARSSSSRGDDAGATPRRDLYDVLGLLPSASPPEIRKAYHKLARTHHPDKVAGDAEAKRVANARFQEIGHAYSVLSDPDTRKEYDAIGMAMFDAPGAYDHFEAEQARMMYCEALGVRECVVRELECELEELFHGCVKRMGVVVVGFDEHTRKAVSRSRVFTVRVHRGWRDGMELKFAATGSDLQSVMFVIRERTHARFERVNGGRDVATWIALEPRQAVNGCVITTSSISGREIKLAIKPNSHTIARGEKKVIIGEGFRVPGDENRGDMIIYFRIMSKVEAYLKQGSGWRWRWARRAAIGLGVWIALNVAGEILLYVVEDLLLLGGIPDSFLLDMFPAHYGVFDTSAWWPKFKIPERLVEEWTGELALAKGVPWYFMEHAPSRAFLRRIIAGVGARQTRGR